MMREIIVKRLLPSGCCTSTRAASPAAGVEALTSPFILNAGGSLHLLKTMFKKKFVKICAPSFPAVGAYFEFLTLCLSLCCAELIKSPTKWLFANF